MIDIFTAIIKTVFNMALLYMNLKINNNSKYKNETIQNVKTLCTFDLYKNLVYEYTINASIKYIKIKNGKLLITISCLKHKKIIF